MATDAAATETVSECGAMGSIDRGNVDQYIVANPNRDDAWVSVQLGDAATLPEWR